MFKLKETLKDFSKTRSRLITFLILLLICLITMGAVNDIAVKNIVIHETNVFENVENSVVVKTRQTTVGQLLNEQNITIGEYDDLNLMHDEELSDNTEIIIRRGVPFTVVTAQGEERVSTTKATVGEALLEAGILIEESDETVPSKDSAVIADMTVSIAKITVSDISVEESIAYSTKKEETDSLYKGKTKTTQKGVNGTKTVVYRITQRDGVEVSRELVSEVVTQEPIEEIVQVGTKANTVTTYQASKSGQLSSRGDIRYKASYTMKATAYDPSPGANGGASKTATGTVPKYGVVAVDPKVIPLGSRLYIESSDGGKSWVYGYAIAGDTGGAIKGNKIDLCFGTKAEAYAFGVKNATVYVLE